VGNRVGVEEGAGVTVEVGVAVGATGIWYMELQTRTRQAARRKKTNVRERNVDVFMDAWIPYLPYFTLIAGTIKNSGDDPGRHRCLL